MQALKGVVILMTLTIAVLMTLIVYGMYQKSQNPDFKFFDLGGSDTAAPAAPAAAVTATAPVSGLAEAPTTALRAFGDITLPLGANARIVSATVTGNRLVVITSAPSGEQMGGDQVWVVDMASGKVLGRVKATGTP